MQGYKPIVSQGAHGVQSYPLQSIVKIQKQQQSVKIECNTHRYSSGSGSSGNNHKSASNESQN